MTLPAIQPGLVKPGDRIAGKYEVVRVVGEGGMGVVYEVVHTRLQQRSAIKMLLPRVQMMAEVVARFEREARAACRLRSRYAVRILDVDHDAGRAYLVMEYLEGHDLSHELHVRGRLPVSEAVDVVMMACAAIAEAHAGGVVHRDLKPSNLFLVREGGKRIVKLLDFGISKITSEGEAHVTSTFATMGTPLYMSPEQIRSAKNVDARTDIWSLGIILFEALAGVRPFQGTTTAAAAAIVADDPPALREIAPEIPEALEAAVMRALAKKQDERFADVKALAQAIAPFGTQPELLAEIAEAAVPRAQTASLPAAGRPQSTPSFVHAATVAQPTPPTSRPLSPLSPLAASLAEKVPGASSASGMGSKASSEAPSTQAAWSDRGATRASKATRVWIVLGAAAVLGAIGGVVVARRGPEASAPPGTTTASANTSPTATASAPVTATATASAPAAASATATAIASASTAAPAPPAPSPRARPRPRPASSAVSPPAPAPKPPSPSPAPTNPVHL